MSVAYLKQQINDLKEANVKLQEDVKRLQGQVKLLKEYADRYKPPIGQSYRPYQPGIL